MSQASTIRNKYRLQLPYRILMAMALSLGSCIPVLLVLGTLIRDRGLVLLILLLVFGALLLVSFCIWSSIYLAVSPHGIEYHHLFYSIITDWDNIERMGSVGAWPVEGLILRQPALRASFLLRMYAMLTIPNVERSIPLQVFEVRRWRDANLGREIRKYVPHLFK